MTGNGTFAAGHALRYMTALRREALAGDQPAIMQMYERGWNTQVPPGRISFGVEVEFYGMGQDSAADLLRGAGINARNDGYHHENRPYWRVTEDGSVSYEGCELVSPILRMGKDDFSLMRKAVRVLADNGGEVNASCGLHVHHNTAGHTSETIAQAVGHYALFQHHINKMLPPSRSHASYALPMEGARHWYNDILAQANGSATIARISRQSHRWGRYHAINMQSLTAHNTLEFRQHSGTLNGDKIEHWTRFTKAIMDSGKRGKTFMDLIDKYGSEGAVVSNMTIDDVCRYLRLPADTREFCVDRTRRLNQGTPDADDTAANVGDWDTINDPYYCASCGETHEPEEQYDDDHDNDYA
jgi:hypothetical protein